MKNIQEQLTDKKDTAIENINEATEIVREQVDNIPDDMNNSIEKLSDKKDQVTESIQENYEGSWLVRNKGWVFLGTIFAAIGTAVAFLFTRDRDVSVQTS